MNRGTQTVARSREDARIGVLRAFADSREPPTSGVANKLNTISTAYNADGEVTSTGDNFSSYAFGYDGQGNVTSVDNAGTPNAPHVVLSSVFDAQGNRTSLAATINGTADFINGYSYDALSRLRNITQQGQTGGNAVAPKSIYIGLDGVGNITELDYSNSVDQGPPQYGPGYATLSYDSTTGLLTGINDVANGTSIDNLAYTYDPLARVSTFTSIDGTATYGYDHTSQLVSASYTTATGGHQPGNVSFNWDANGNNAAQGNVVSANNEVTHDGTFTYSFDADGNRTSRTRISSDYASDYKVTYSWDYRNRLTDVEYFDNNSVLTKHVHDVYDVYDNLIEEDIDPTGGGSYTTIEQFTLDVTPKLPVQVLSLSGTIDPTAPDDTLLEFVNGPLAYRFLNGPSPSGADAIYAEGAVDSLLEPDVPDWVFVNNQGSPTDVADSSGNLIDHQVYSPFGQVVYVSNSGVYVFEGYTGGIADPNTGLVKLGERWYDPAATVWISSDPAGFRAGDPNLARYVGNAPSLLSDPGGEDWLDNAANFCAGFGDSLSFGITDWVRDKAGINGGINHSGGWYIGGEVVEIGGEILVTGGGAALRHGAGRVSAKAVGGAARSAGRRIVPGTGGAVHHINTLFGHPPIPGGRGAVRSLFPIGGLPQPIHTSSWNLCRVGRETHNYLHWRAYWAELILWGGTLPPLTIARGGLDTWRGLGDDGAPVQEQDGANDAAQPE